MSEAEVGAAADRELLMAVDGEAARRSCWPMRIAGHVLRGGVGALTWAADTIGEPIRTPTAALGAAAGAEFNGSPADEEILAATPAPVSGDAVVMERGEDQPPQDPRNEVEDGETDEGQSVIGDLVDHVRGLVPRAPRLVLMGLLFVVLGLGRWGVGTVGPPAQEPSQSSLSSPAARRGCRTHEAIPATPEGTSLPSAAFNFALSSAEFGTALEVKVTIKSGATPTTKKTASVFSAFLKASNSTSNSTSRSNSTSNSTSNSDSNAVKKSSRASKAKQWVKQLARRQSQYWREALTEEFILHGPWAD